MYSCNYQAASKILNITPLEVHFASGSDYLNSAISSIYRHIDIETINVWKNEFNQYTSPSGKNTSKSDIDYLK